MPATSVVRVLALPETEQRLHRCYPIELDLQYKVWRRKHLVGSGSGRTSSIGTAEIFFQTKDPVPSEGQIDLYLDWPFSLDDDCPLMLRARGEIVRNDVMGTAVAVFRYDFRTTKRRAM